MATTTTTATKPFDIVVFGATGFTGTLVARYLLQERESAPDAPNALRWAIAARSESKLAGVKHELKSRLPSVAPSVIDAVPTIVADSGDEASLVAMVRQTKVVLSVVGPYKLYGSLLVKVCAENGVHYCDTTGEALWVDEVSRKYGAAAKRTGAILVSCCAFESIPSDLTAFLVADKIETTRQSAASKIDFYFTKLKKGSASGGTLASVFAFMDSATSADLKRARNPFVLTDAETIAAKEAAKLVAPNSTSLKVQYDRVLKRWTSVFIGGSVNQAVVHRSNYLLKNRYGDALVYRDRLAIGGFWKSLARTTGVALLGVTLYFRGTRALLKRLAPASGEGPSEEVMKNGYFVAEAIGYVASDRSDVPAVKATVVGSGDPGYSLTSKMASEAAFCLAKDELNAGTTGGFYTPASAFGHHLAKRLDAKKHITFKLESL